MIILLASFIPAGAFSLNPKVLNDLPLEGQEGAADLGLEKGDMSIDKEHSYNHKAGSDEEYPSKEQQRI